MHRAEHPARQFKAGNLRQNIEFCGIHRDISALLQDFPGLILRGEETILHQKRDRFVTGIERPQNNLGAFRNEKPLLRFVPV